jgi:hypothetical protein
MITPLMLKKTIIIVFTCDLLVLAFSFSMKWMSSNALIVSLFLLEFFHFHKKFQINVLLNFHPSHESGGTTQHGHIQTKPEANQLIQRDKTSLISFQKLQLDYLAFASHFYSFPGSVCAVPLFNSHTLYSRLLDELDFG